MPKKTINQLSALDVKNKGPGLHADGSGLYLKVLPGGARSWVFRYLSPVTDKRRDMAIGSTSGWSLSAARDRRAELERMVDSGIDPLEHRRAEEAVAAAVAIKVPTFREVANAFITLRAPSWRSSKQLQIWQSSLATYCGSIMDKPVSTITRPDVLAILAPIWSSKTESASRLRERIDLVMNAAIAQGMHPGPSPAAWRGGLEALLPKPSKVASVEHHPALPWREAPAFMAELRSSLSTSRLALEMLILTACRAAEVAGARWAEVDLQARIWSIPASRMKAGKLHRVPLSDRVMEILKVLPRNGPGVFPGLGGRTTMNPESLRRCLHRDAGREDLSVHGWRSCFRDWCRDNRHSSELAELSLAHAVGDQVERAYARSDGLEQRRELMQAWSDFLSGAAP